MTKNISPPSSSVDHFLGSRKPKVTVIALCFNHSRFLIECLESIRCQTYQNFELIVTDDCSTDNSQELISDWLLNNYPEARFIRHNENKGLCRTLNEALHLANGEFISMIATDDAWEPYKIECQLAAISQLDPKTAVVYSDASRIDEHSQRLEKDFIEFHTPECTRPSGKIFAELANRNFIPAMATLIRREALESVGWYDERLVYEDYDMWLRLANCYEFIYYPSIVARYRIVSTSMVRTMFTKPTTAYLFSVFLICIKWLPTSCLNKSQQKKWRQRLWEVAYGLYVAEDPRAPTCLWKAAWYSKKPYAAFLGLTQRIGITRSVAKRLTRKTN